MTQRNHHEREFEAFLAGEESELARLYRRLPQNEPDAKLDAAVLAMARAAVEPQRVNALRHAKDRHRRPLWLVGLSSAAGVVLAAGLAWQMRGAFNETLPSSRGAAPPAASAERDVIPISAIVPPPEPAPAAPPPSPLVTDVPADEEAAKQRMAESASALPPPAKTAPHRRVTELAASADNATDKKKDASARAEPAVPQEPQPPAPAPAVLADTRAERPGGPATETAAAPARGGSVEALGNDGGVPRPQAFPTAGASDHNSVERKAAIATGTRRDDYGVGTDAGSADPLVKQEQRQRVARQAAKESSASGVGLARKPATEPATAAAAPAAQAEAAASVAPRVPTQAEGASANETELQRNARLKPDEWIIKIRALLRDDRRAAAIENLDLLRERHPDYRIPADLRELR